MNQNMLIQPFFDRGCENLRKIEKIDVGLISKFREKVDDYIDFFTNPHSFQKEKNMWNLVCSSMDWIDVACSYINQMKLTNDDENAIAIETYTYISCIDMIWSSVQQLHRALFGDSDIPFAGQTHIFNDLRLGKDDNQYFKHIRAIFGAHPVNVDDDHKRFASWPTSRVNCDFDISVNLYASNHNSNDFWVGLNYSDLAKFQDRTYTYLYRLMDQVDRLYDLHRDHYRVDIISFDGADVKSVLKKLLIENEVRTNNDYYKSSIEDLLKLYDVKCSDSKNDSLVNGYRENLRLVVDELAKNIQTMDISDLEYEWILNPVRYFKFPNFHYTYAALTDHIWGTGSKRIIGLKNITESPLNQYVIFNWETLDELYLLIKCASFAYNNREASSNRSEQ